MPKNQGSFLADLPPSIKRYTCHGKQHLLNIFESEPFDSSTDTSKFLLFHASEKTIEAIFDTQNEDDWLPNLRSSFDTHEQLFLVTMVSDAHGAATDAMGDAISQTFQRHGVLQYLRGFTGVTVRNDGRGEQADRGWGPRRPPPGEPRTPSLTLEVAYSEADCKLDSDVRFWLSPDDGNANICLTLRINRSEQEIRIEKWEIQNSRRHRTQTVLITKRENRVRVTDHPLKIPFKGLFRRLPQTPGEKDPEVSQGQLEDIADQIWAAQGW